MATEVRVFVLRHLGLLETAGASQNKSVATILVSIGRLEMFSVGGKKNLIILHVLFILQKSYRRSCLNASLAYPFKSFFAGVLSRTPLAELTTLPQTP